jgi:hypothetical protein
MRLRVVEDGGHRRDDRRDGGDDEEDEARLLPQGLRPLRVGHAVGGLVIDERVDRADVFVLRAAKLAVHQLTRGSVVALLREREEISLERLVARARRDDLLEHGALRVARHELADALERFPCGLGVAARRGELGLDRLLVLQDDDAVHLARALQQRLDNLAAHGELGHPPLGEFVHARSEHTQAHEAHRHRGHEQRDHQRETQPQPNPYRRPSHVAANRWNPALQCGTRGGGVGVIRVTFGAPRAFSFVARSRRTSRSL